MGMLSGWEFDRPAGSADLLEVLAVVDPSCVCTKTVEHALADDEIEQQEPDDGAEHPERDVQDKEKVELSFEIHRPTLARLDRRKQIEEKAPEDCRSLRFSGAFFGRADRI